MKVEIWSDIMCPFCYIGKRRFELAMEQFEYKDRIQIEWKSFLLSPDTETDPTINMHEFLAKHKGISVEEATGLNDYVTNMAAQSGLTYNFDKAIPANCFNAHRLIHFAKQHGKQDAAEEALFKAYFTDGRNIDDATTLLKIADELGLDSGAFGLAMSDNEYTQAVLNDIEEAQQLGVRGVPFFVFNRKYAVSGAQDATVFLETLETAYNELGSENNNE